MRRWVDGWMREGERGVDAQMRRWVDEGGVKTPRETWG